MDYRFVQQLLSDFEIQEQLYHLFNYILFYQQLSLILKQLLICSIQYNTYE